MKPMRMLSSKIANLFGYELVKRKKTGNDPFADMKRMLLTDTPTIFDVGANRGQTAKKMKRAFPNATVHSFEPSPKMFERMQADTQKLRGVKLHNCAMGSSPSKMMFKENVHSQMSSFLELSTFGAGVIEREIEVDVKTVDHVAEMQGIEMIDILKSDTQGYDLEVFKGAENMIRRKKVGMIYFEIIFSDMYKNLPSMEELFAFMTHHEFQLVSFYKCYYQKELASWTDALFVSKSYFDQRFG